MTTRLGKFTARAFRKLLANYVLSYFPFGFEGRIWYLIVSVPDHCLCFYFSQVGWGLMLCLWLGPPWFN